MTVNTDGTAINNRVCRMPADLTHWESDQSRQVGLWEVIVLPNYGLAGTGPAGSSRAYANPHKPDA